MLVTLPAYRGVIGKEEGINESGIDEISDYYRAYRCRFYVPLIVDFYPAAFQFCHRRSAE